MLRRPLPFAALAALSLALLDAAPRPAPVSYRRYKLHELVCIADVLVSGTITSVEGKSAGEPDTFTLDVEQTVLGSHLPKPLVVGCFHNWTCARRWAPYEKGQRVLLFLLSPAKGSTVYAILGAGDEGEMPLEGENVFAHGYGIRGQLTPGTPREEAPVLGSRVPLAEFATAVRGFRQNFAWSLDACSGIPVGLRPAQDIQKVKLFAATSPMARQLSADVRSSESWNGPPEPLPELVLPAEVRTRREGKGEFGSSLCALGDVDGDGVVDVAAGDAWDDTIINQHGALRVLLLAAGGTPKSIRKLDETVGSYPARMNEFAHLGRGVAPVGDIDGDGVPDLVVSAPGFGRSWEGRGSVWILCLNRDGSARQSIELDGDEKLRELGVTIGSGLGASIAALGDLDGDGAPELALGQDPKFDKGYKEGQSVFIVSLGRGGTVRWARKIHDHADGISESYSRFGASLAGLGDVDGDGVPDLAASEDNCADGGEGRGAAWVLCLKRDGTLKSKRKISDWSGDFEGRLRDRSAFGRELFALGDIDSDGIPDLAASTKDGLWFLSLNRDGSVRESCLLPEVERPESPARRHILALLRLPSPTQEPGERIVLFGWTRAFDGLAEGKEWFLRFDAQGRLQSW